MITFANKTTLNPQPSIADENKVTAGDMNEIKSVYNTEIGDVSSLNTSASSVVGAINELKNGETYSTSEIVVGTWLNKPLYRKVIEFGSLPNSTAKEVNHNISNIDKIVHQEAIAMESGGTTYSIPHVSAPNMSSGMTMSLRSTHTWVQIYCSANMSSYTGYFILEYTKTTD